MICCLLLAFAYGTQAVERQKLNVFDKPYEHSQS